MEIGKLRKLEEIYRNIMLLPTISISRFSRCYHVVIVLLSANHQRLVICRVVSSVVAGNCPSTLQADACSGGGRACRHRHRAIRRPCHLSSFLIWSVSQ